MKKAALLFVLLPLLAVAGFAQESRQDVSLGVTGVFPPDVYGNAVQEFGRNGMGGLASYRYMLTPRSAVEGNYQYSQNAYSFATSFLPNTRVHTRMQEVSAAYVFNFNYRKFNPFLEGGVGGYIFTPILSGTTYFDTKRQTEIGVLYGGGVAYEISPSFDIRAEFRGIVVKAPSFKVPGNIFNTGRWMPTLSNPMIGVAYHF
jgi:outer membrane immunogenic protein